MKHSSAIALLFMVVSFWANAKPLTPEQHKDRTCDDFLKDKSYRFKSPTPQQTCDHQHTQAIEICNPQAGKITSPQAYEFHKEYCPLHLSTQEIRNQAHLYSVPLPEIHADFLELNRQVEKTAMTINSRASFEYTKKLSESMGRRDLFHHEACIKAVSTCSKVCTDSPEKKETCNILWEQTHKMADFANQMLATSHHSQQVQEDSTDNGSSSAENLGRMVRAAAIGAGVAIAVHSMTSSKQNPTTAYPSREIQSEEKRTYREPSEQRINPTVSTLITAIAEYKNDNRPEKVNEAVRKLIELNHLDEAEKEVRELESSDNFVLSNVGKKLRQALEEKQLYSSR